MMDKLVGYQRIREIMSRATIKEGTAFSRPLQRLLKGGRNNGPDRAAGRRGRGNLVPGHFGDRESGERVDRQLGANGDGRGRPRAAAARASRRGRGVLCARGRVVDNLRRPPLQRRVGVVCPHSERRPAHLQGRATGEVAHPGAERRLHELCSRDGRACANKELAGPGRTARHREAQPACGKARHGDTWATAAVTTNRTIKEDPRPKRVTSPWQQRRQFTRPRLMKYLRSSSPASTQRSVTTSSASTSAARLPPATSSTPVKSTSSSRPNARCPTAKPKR